MPPPDLPEGVEMLEWRWLICRRGPERAVVGSLRPGELRGPNEWLGDVAE